MKAKLWPLPVGKMFGVGSRMSRHLERMAIRTIGHLAQTPVQKLRKRWGINGEVLWLTANGIDHSPVSHQTHDRQKAIGHHMTLPRDYTTLGEIKVILLELSEEVGRRARYKHSIGKTISVGVRGHDFDFPTGFHRQTQLFYPTDYGLDIFRAAFQLFRNHWDGHPVRSVGVTLSGLESAEFRQVHLFESFLKKENLSRAIDAIQDKYGASSILRASSFTAAGQARERAQKIGGHYK